MDSCKTMKEITEKDGADLPGPEQKDAITARMQM